MRCFKCVVNLWRCKIFIIVLFNETEKNRVGIESGAAAILLQTFQPVLLTRLSYLIIELHRVSIVIIPEYLFTIYLREYYFRLSYFILETLIAMYIVISEHCLVIF